ncbi:MAG TPA: hypothetical protein VGM72_00380 [Micropepsaceae bacterium]|jgi:hypothetical protein
MTPRAILLAIAVTGLALCGVGLFVDTKAALSAYLAACVTVASIPMGALAVLLTTYLVRAAWTEGMHAPLAAASLTIPGAGLLFIPVFVGLSWLYPWATRVEPGPLKVIYLTPWFYILRTLIYLASLSAIAFWAARAWKKLAEMIRVASIGLIVYALVASFAGIDWIESLEPSFHSSEFGLIFLASQLLAGLCFALVMTLWHQKPESTHAYGATLLSTLLLWAYLQAMQYIIIWSANIPDEALWYLRRAEAPWDAVLWTLAILQFVVPFFALLSMRVRTGRTPILTIACVTLALRYLEAIWLIFPATGTSNWILWIVIPAAICGVGGTWLLIFERALAWSAHQFSREATP